MSEGIKNLSIDDQSTADQNRTSTCFLITLSIMASIGLFVYGEENNMAFAITELNDAKELIRIAYNEYNKHYVYLTCSYSSNGNVSYKWMLNDTVRREATSRNLSINENIESPETIFYTTFRCFASEGNVTLESVTVKLREPQLETWLMIIGIAGVVVFSLLGMANLTTKKEKK